MDEQTLIDAYRHARRVDTWAGEPCATPRCPRRTSEDGTFFCADCRRGINELTRPKHDRDA